MAYYFDPSAPVRPQRPEDERRWAAFAHLSVVAPLAGPLVVYFITRKEQPWAARHALQALAYCMGVIVLEIGLLLASLVAGIVLTMAGGSPGGPPGQMLCALPSLLAIGALGLAGYAAYRCYRGDGYKYPVVGDLIEGL